MAGVYPPAIQNRGVAGGSNAQFSLLLAWLHCGRLRLCRRFWCFHDCCPEKVWRGGRGHDCPIGTRQNVCDSTPGLSRICGGRISRKTYFCKRAHGAFSLGPSTIAVTSPSIFAPKCLCGFEGFHFCMSGFVMGYPCLKTCGIVHSRRKRGGGKRPCYESACNGV